MMVPEAGKTVSGFTLYWVVLLDRNMKRKSGNESRKNLCEFVFFREYISQNSVPFVIFCCGSLGENRIP